MMPDISKMLNDKVLKGVIIGVILLLLAITIIFLFTDNIKFDNNLSYVDIVSVLINILLVYYISYLLIKKDSIAKTEKDLLIKYIEDFQAKKNQIVYSVNNLFDYSNNSELQILISNLKSLRTELKLKLDLLVENNYIDKNCDLYSNSNSVMTNIWKDLTYQPSTRDLNFVRDIYINRSRQSSNLLDKHLFNLIKKINSK